MVDYQAEDMLARVLRHHDVTVSRKMLIDLGEVVEWVRECDRIIARQNYDGEIARPALTVLASLGIYGREAIDKVGVA